MPARCPVCHTRVVHDGPFDRCPNGLACRAQLERAIQHFASREALDIRGLGPATVHALVSEGLVRSVADLFTLTHRDLLKVERFADQSATKLLDAIGKARHTSLWRFLHALGIPGVGCQTARDLAAHFGTLDGIQSAGEAALRRAAGIGPAAAHDVTEFFRRAVNRRVIELCRHRGLQVSGSVVRERGALAGKTVVFTGGLASMTREDAEEQARTRGAQTARSVSAATDLLVAGAAPGSKFARARALGVRIIDEGQFQKLIAAHG
jgi:DNA ligase (NAD+)